MALGLYDNSIASFFNFMGELSQGFVDMIQQRLAVNKSNQEQRALDRRIRRVQKEIKKQILPRLATTYNAGMIQNEVNIEFSQGGDTQQMRNEITWQFQFELLDIPIPTQ